MKDNRFLKCAILIASILLMVMSGHDAFAQNAKKKKVLAPGATKVNYDRKCNDIFKMEGVDGLIERKYDVNCKLPEKSDESGLNVIFDKTKSNNVVTPLFYAIEPEEIDTLVKAGAKINAKDSNGQTALYNIITVDGGEEMIDALVKYKINVNSKDKAGMTALDYAVPYLLVNAYSWIEDGVLSGDDFVDNEGGNYLKSFDVVQTNMKKLIALGTKFKKNKYKSKEFQEMEPAEFVQAVLASVDLNAKDVHGRTILQNVMMRRIKEMPHSKSFIEACKDNKVIPRDIISGQLYDPIKTVIDAGADVNIKDSNGRTAIFYARNPHVVEALIQAKAKLDIKDSQGNTPLLWIAKNIDNISNIEKIIEQFKEAGADINATDKDGKTAQYYIDNPSQYHMDNPSKETGSEEHILRF